MESKPLLCDGGQCAAKEQCVWCMENVDMGRMKDYHVVLNTTSRICCVRFLARPNNDYPDNGNNTTYDK